jgi:hypothetical protein
LFRRRSEYSRALIAGAPRAVLTSITIASLLKIMMAKS